MIYAIRAVGTEYIKFGRAASVGRRLKELDTGCPHDLHIEAVADWPDGQERAVHAYLAEHFEKLEWFRDGERAQRVIGWMRNGDAGLRAFRVAFLEHAKAKPMKVSLMVALEYQRPSEPKKSEERRSPRIGWEASISAPSFTDDQTGTRFERIKQRALAKQAAKRSEEAAS